MSLFLTLFLDMRLANKLCARLTVCYLAALIAIAVFFGFLALFGWAILTAPTMLAAVFLVGLAVSGPPYLLALILTAAFAKYIVRHPLSWIGSGTLVAAGMLYTVLPDGLLGVLAAVLVGTSFYVWNARSPLGQQPGPAAMV